MNDSTTTECRHNRNEGRSAPLVIAITGDTGIGKTETAWTLGMALLAGGAPYLTGKLGMPPGFVKLRGEVLQQREHTV
jgi:pantothenate kinase-related protein Tda10